MKTKKQHTPGPWHFEDDALYEIKDVKNGQILAEVYAVNTVNAFDPEQEANAALIAAAPTMLGELRDAVAALERGDLPNVGDMKEAIEKAEGGAS